MVKKCHFSVFKRLEDVWFLRWKCVSQARVARFPPAEWFDLLRCPHTEYMYMFWNRSLDVLRWNILFSRRASCMNRGPRGPLTHLASLLVSRPRCDLHRFSLPTLHFPTNIMMHSWWPPRPLWYRRCHLFQSKKVKGQSPFKYVFLFVLFKINVRLLFYWYNEENEKEGLFSDKNEVLKLGRCLNCRWSVFIGQSRGSF